MVERWHGLAGLEHGFGGREEPVVPGVATLRQGHGSAVVDASEVRGSRVEGDGLGSDRPGVRVGVWTADCVPVLLVAPARRVTAAIHAGWRGSASGVVEAAIAFLERRWNVLPAELEAALGPSIGECCYEVGEDVRGAFVSRHGARASSAFIERERSLRLDLRRFLGERLRDLGVATVEQVGPCTACRTDVLYSYRKEGPTGRQLSHVGFV